MLCKLPSKFLGPDGMNPGLLKEITDNHREHNKHRRGFKRAGWRLITTQKWQNTKQGNGSTICSSPTSVLCRTLEATNPAWVKLQNNSSHVHPWDGDPLPCPTQGSAPPALPALTAQNSLPNMQSKAETAAIGEGKRRHLNHCWDSEMMFDSKCDFTKVCQSCHTAEQGGQRDQPWRFQNISVIITELQAAFVHRHSLIPLL